MSKKIGKIKSSFDINSRIVKKSRYQKKRNPPIRVIINSPLVDSMTIQHSDPITLNEHRFLLDQIVNESNKNTQSEPNQIAEGNDGMI